jgi:3-oxoacyl-[acyl-carrier protein] reductase
MRRVALVVGGGSGIGQAVVQQLAGDGLRIAVAGRAPSDGVIAALAGAGHRGYFVDVADERSVGDLFDKVEADLGAITVMVNCAGVAGFIDGARPSLANTPIESWRSVLDINATGMFLCLREVLRRRAHGAVEHGRIVMIGSMAAQDGGKNSPPAYVASKGAVHALTKSVMGEAAALGMTVNCVAPGAIDTPLLRAVLPFERQSAAFAGSPLGRAGLAQEVAAVVAFLVSPAAAFVTGACYDVNGGVRMS